MRDPAPTGPLGLRLAGFGGLAALASASWVALVSDPPLGQALLAVLAACGGAAALATLGSARPSHGGTRAVALLVALATVGLGLIAVGLSAELLAPAGWGELADGIGRGLSGLPDARFPYAGHNPWARLVILLALPLVLALAAALAFWPGRRQRGGLALVLLIALYAVGVTVRPPALPLLWGLALMALVASWLWLPGLERRFARGAVAAVAAASVAGFGAAALLDADDPWLDWTGWRLAGEQPAVKFNWAPTYGPLDWPRQGSALLRAQSELPHYWRTIELSEFNGLRWDIAGGRLGFDSPLELPRQVEGPSAGRLNPDWIERVTFTVGALDSRFLIAPGAVRAVDGVGVIAGPGGTSLLTQPLGEGDEYTVTSYVPEPTAAQLRAAPAGYAPALRRYTELALPQRSQAIEADGGSTLEVGPGVSVPLRGSTAPAKIDRRLRGWPYARVQALARRLTAGAPTAYDAVTAVERHLQRGYAYDEAPPARRVPLRAFLFTDRIGYCQQFSGAMALMLRMIGIPSRVASGFSAGERDDAGAFQISDRDAHSWVEVYFNGIGWVPFDPTPAAAPATSQLSELGVSRDGAGAVVQRHGRSPSAAGVDPAQLSSGGGPWPSLLTGLLVLSGLAIAAALALAAAIAWRALRFSGLAPAAAAEAQALELKRALPQLGFPIPDGATLVELERRLRSRRGVVSYLARLRASRYRPGQSPPGLAERRRLRRELVADRGLVGRLRGLLAMPPGSPR